MATKEKVLNLFEANRGGYFSGEDIARKLSISRAAIWKAVKSLQSEGYVKKQLTEQWIDIWFLQMNKHLGVAEFLNRFNAYYIAPCQSDYVEKYRSRILVIGKQIIIVSGNEFKSAFVLGVDEQCHLLVKYADGKEACYSLGKISVQC